MDYNESIAYDELNTVKEGKTINVYFKRAASFKPVAFLFLKSLRISINDNPWFTFCCATIIARHCRIMFDVCDAMLLV